MSRACEEARDRESRGLRVGPARRHEIASLEGECGTEEASQKGPWGWRTGTYEKPQAFRLGFESEQKVRCGPRKSPI